MKEFWWFCFLSCVNIFSSLMQPKGQTTNPWERWMAFRSKKDISLGNRSLLDVTYPQEGSFETRANAAGFLGRPASTVWLRRSSGPKCYTVLWPSQSHLLTARRGTMGASILPRLVGAREAHFPAGQLDAVEGSQLQPFWNYLPSRTGQCPTRCNAKG